MGNTIYLHAHKPRSLVLQGSAKYGMHSDRVSPLKEVLIAAVTYSALFKGSYCNVPWSIEKVSAPSIAQGLAWDKIILSFISTVICCDTPTL